MKRYTIGPSMMLILMLALPGQLVVAQNLEGRITAQQALDQAEIANPELGRLRARLEAEQGRRAGAFGINNPQLNYAREAIPNGEGGFGEQRWVIQQSIDSPLESIARLKQNRASQEAIEAEIKAERLRLHERVKQAYLDMVYAEALTDWRQRAVVLGDTLLRVTRQRIEAGEAAELDHMRLELDQAAILSDLEQAMRMKTQACVNLYQAIGDEVPANGCALTTADELLPLNVSVTHEAVMQSIGADPEITQASSAFSAAQFNIQRTKGAYFPRLHVNYWPQDFGAGYDFHGFEVGVSVPVWFAFNQRSATRVARAEAQQRHWDMQDVSVRLQGEREKAWTSFTISRDALSRYEQQVNLRADSTLQLTRRAYELGEIDLLPLLDTRRMYIDVRLRYLETLKAYYRDLIKLERFAGKPLVF